MDVVETTNKHAADALASNGDYSISTRLELNRVIYIIRPVGKLTHANLQKQNIQDDTYFDGNTTPQNANKVLKSARSIPALRPTESTRLRRVGSTPALSIAKLGAKAAPDLFVRQVASSDSVKTARPSPSHLTRFQQPTVFDFLSNLPISPIIDDPRFIIWTSQGDSTRSSIDDTKFWKASPATSATPSPATSVSKHWSLHHASSPASSLRQSLSSVIAHKALMAATVESLITHLTSTIEAELLSGFFLTFRSFIRPVDLLRLLITRFEWAHSIPVDHRRVVQVRTFVVIRYWLLFHFEDDFVPDKQLRNILVDWLNTSDADVIYKENPREGKLIKGLKKAALGVKDRYLSSTPGGMLPKSDSEPLLDADIDLDFVIDSSLSPTRSRIPLPPALHALDKLSLHPHDKLPNQTIVARGFTSALGTIGKFKRRLGSRAPVPTKSGATAETQQDIFDETSTGDLLWVKGGLDQYLQYHNIPTNTVELSTEDSPIPSTTQEKVEQLPTLDIPEPASRPKNELSLFDYHPGTFYRSTPHPDRIELDDVDLSDEDEDVMEVKRTLKRAPGTLNLRTLKDVPLRPVSVDTISSLGSPHTSDSTDLEYIDDEEGAQRWTVVPGFDLNGMESDDEEADDGGIEAALRRLEGYVDEKKELENAKKVQLQMDRSEKRLRERRASFAPSETEESVISTDRSDGPGSTDQTSSPMSQTVPKLNVIITEPTSPSPSRLSKSGRTSDLKSSLRNPLSTIARKPSMSKLLFQKVQNRTSLSNSPSTGGQPPIHRSFILSFRTENLAQQFCLIERDLFRVLSWQELVGGSWMDTSNPTNHGDGSEFDGDVVDWEKYLKEERRRKLVAQQEGSALPSAVQAMIARYNLTCNWVVSEILLTHNLEERVTLIAKFIRLAFKCYRQSNFQTTTQIIHGLETVEIQRLRKTWQKVPMYELRKFNGLKALIDPDRNFGNLRDACKALLAENAMSFTTANDSSKSVHLSKSSKSLTPTACLPFLGLFLKDLATISGLPTFLDPSNPSIAAQVTPYGSLQGLSSPESISHLPPLPEGIALQPLVNVHKALLLAGVVQQVVTFQGMSDLYGYSSDKELYLNALRIRCLGATTREELSKRLASQE